MTGCESVAALVTAPPDPAAAVLVVAEVLTVVALVVEGVEAADRAAVEKPEFGCVGRGG